MHELIVIRKLKECVCLVRSRPKNAPQAPVTVLLYLRAHQLISASHDNIYLVFTFFRCHGIHGHLHQVHDHLEARPSKEQAQSPSHLANQTELVKGFKLFRHFCYSLEKKELK